MPTTASLLLLLEEQIHSKIQGETIHLGVLVIADYEIVLGFVNLVTNFSLVQVECAYDSFSVIPLSKNIYSYEDYANQEGSNGNRSDSAIDTNPAKDGSYEEIDLVPTPKMNILKNLGLNVVKVKVRLDSSGKHNTFSITKS
ncbi:hypothetical protein L2E82_45904 [Cichorium intybus]|uniref:Uncharacterized protein n=1 Tax=Cichorium intybus TaxID=13427 RepID=A0ACB8ZU76_CICIN|nr:hypothetical protein L2E82_45904 [Cichorium intybus]